MNVTNKNRKSRKHKNLLERAEGSEKLDISWWRICVDLSLLQFRENEYEEDQAVVVEQSSLQCGVPAVHGSFAEKTAKTLALFRNDAEKQMLRYFLG